jgi:hypothetical protein
VEHLVLHDAILAQAHVQHLVLHHVDLVLRCHNKIAADILQYVQLHSVNHNVHLDAHNLAHLLAHHLAHLDAHHVALNLATVGRNEMYSGSEGNFPYRT